MKIPKLSRRRPRSVDDAELGHFIVFLQRATKKCTKIYSARAQLLFCSLNFSFGDVLVAVVVVVCLNPLLFFVKRLRAVQNIYNAYMHGNCSVY